MQIANPWFEGGANRPSLVQSQKNYAKFGAMEERFLSNVRAPTGDDAQSPGWRLVREEDKEHATTPREIEELRDQGRAVPYEYWIRAQTHRR